MPAARVPEDDHADRDPARPDDVDTHPIARPPGWGAVHGGRGARPRPDAAPDRPRRRPLDAGTDAGADDRVAARDEGDRGRRRGAHGRAPGAAGKKPGSWRRELPVLAVFAVVLIFLIQTFVGRPYEIPSGSMERTLHGCTGCTNDRVAADKITYRFTDPAPGDVVIFKGPPAWTEDEDGLAAQRSGNPVLHTVQDALSLVGLAPPDETDFVKRVIAVGGQTVACCDARHRVVVDGRALDEPYLYFQPGHGPPRQEPFGPVRLAPGQLWVMGDNRNNSADAREHGPITTTDVIARARFVMLPVTRWRTVPSVDPQQPEPAAARH